MYFARLSMHFVFRFVSLAVALAGLWLITPAQAASTDDASKFVQNLGDQALSIITNKSFSKDKKQAGLEKIFTANVDFHWIGRFVMGRFWRQATDAQKTRYLKEYQRFLTLHYTARFADYSNGSFKVVSTKDDGDGDFTVAMQLQSDEKNSEPVLVDYRIRRSGGGFKIFDVIVEGVSLIATQRSEFASVITNNGIDYLIDQLATRFKNGDVSLDGAKTASR